MDKSAALKLLNPMENKQYIDLSDRKAMVEWRF